MVQRREPDAPHCHHSRERYCYFTPTPECGELGGQLDVPTLNIIGTKDQVRACVVRVSRVRACVVCVSRVRACVVRVSRVRACVVRVSRARACVAHVFVCVRACVSRVCVSRVCVSRVCACA